MDIADITKVATRKRLNCDAEKLREKVSRETAKIIKLKVAQDTAYWDLKEKLQQVEGNHERLQQNMVDVQMQHEAISGQYQDELRLRPETLNKMSSTREICDVLEEYSERLKDTLGRCKADQAALYDAYQRSGCLVRESKLQQLQAADKHKLHVERLEEKLKLTSEHLAQLTQYMSAAQQQSAADMNAAREQLASERTAASELRTVAADCRRHLDVTRLALQQKEESLSNLKNDMKQLMQEHTAQVTDMKNMLIKQEKDLKEALESNSDLKRALQNQEHFSQSLIDENSQLQNKLSVIEENQAQAIEELLDLKAKLLSASTETDQLKAEIAVVTTDKGKLEILIQQKNELVEKLTQEVERLTILFNTSEAEKLQKTKELVKLKEDFSSKTSCLEETDKAKQDLEKKLADVEEQLCGLRLSTNKQIEDLTKSVQSKESELEERAQTIAQLMADVHSANDAKGRAETALQRLRADCERLQAQLEALQRAAREKEEELSKQMSIILEVRAEKERLQDKIQGMQNTIANIQKELTGRPPVMDPPELDDNNAVMCAPEKQPREPPRPISPKLPQSTSQFKRAKQLDSMLFSIFSDSSMDGDTLDPTEVNRRFDALSRGERVSPQPLTSLKRRAGLQHSQPQLVQDHKISLSQVKNELKNKERTFFKSKRPETKAKKLK